VLGEQAGRPHRNRRVGWRHLHVAIDDHSRLAYAELLPGQDADSCVRFLERATGWYEAHGVPIERVLTDNAKAYHARAWIEAPRRLAIERRYTRIYRPRTNGKAERFIQTLLTECAYARSYRSSSARARARSAATCAGTTDADPTARREPGHRSATSHTSVVTTADME
jgi:transposase InsO family protein